MAWPAVRRATDPGEAASARLRFGPLMTIGGSLFPIALGVILHFAVTRELANIDAQVVGTILMVVGVVGLVLALILLAPRRQTGPPSGFASAWFAFPLQTRGMTPNESWDRTGDATASSVL
jgi:hypothetical protein